MPSAADIARNIINNSEDASILPILTPPPGVCPYSRPPSILIPELGPLERTMGCFSTRFAAIYGLGSDMEPILMRHRPYDPQTHEFSLETHAIRRVLERDDGQEYPLSFHMVDATDACVLPHGPGLVELFWRHVHSCYSTLSKDPFALAFSQSYRRIPAAHLEAVYLSAIHWWTYDPELSSAGSGIHSTMLI
ncbi:hypothetical protein FPRO03_14165 [Fusarium proliferatum]|nr:hypothetical protein FPRO03_14165 [Fusarium proliferatum]